MHRHLPRGESQLAAVRGPDKVVISAPCSGNELGGGGRRDITNVDRIGGKMAPEPLSVSRRHRLAKAIRVASGDNRSDWILISGIRKREIRQIRDQSLSGQDLASSAPGETRFAPFWQIVPAWAVEQAAARWPADSPASGFVVCVCCKPRNAQNAAMQIAPGRPRGPTSVSDCDV